MAKADWREGFKKKQAGVSDMTLLSTISNDSINDNLQKRFQNGDIYVSPPVPASILRAYKLFDLCATH